MLTVEEPHYFKERTGRCAFRGANGVYNHGMLMVEEAHLPMTITVPGITDEEFARLCEQYVDCRIEYTAEGDLIVMPPTDPETGVRNNDISAQLRNWARSTGRGFTTDSSAGFILPSGARRSPDSAWFSKARLRARPTCPEFMIELLSPSDRVRTVHLKMLEWIENGAELGWMINPKTRTVSIYRPGTNEPERRAGILELAGEGPVEGFVLDLSLVWDVQ